MSQKTSKRIKQAQQKVQSEGEQILNLSLTLNETNVIMTGLGELPAKVSIEIINKIQMQAKPQLEPVIPSTPEPPKKPDIPQKS